MYRNFQLKNKKIPNAFGWIIRTIFIEDLIEKDL